MQNHAQSAADQALEGAQAKAQLEQLNALVRELQQRPTSDQAVLEMDERRMNLQKKQETMAGLGAVILLFPLVVAMTIRILRRGQAVSPAHAPIQDERLARLEQAVDAIAFEVERIGEAQRFQTRLMSENVEVRAPR